MGLLCAAPTTSLVTTYSSSLAVLVSLAAEFLSQFANLSILSQVFIGACLSRGNPRVIMAVAGSVAHANNNVFGRCIASAKKLESRM